MKIDRDKLRMKATITNRADRLITASWGSDSFATARDEATAVELLAQVIERRTEGLEEIVNSAIPSTR